MRETEPDSGEFYFYIADEFSWDTYDICKLLDEWSSDYTVLKDLMVVINSLNACWTVPFSEGDSVLVALEDTTNWPSCIRIDILDPLWIGE